MEGFPFTGEEWERIKEGACAIVNASLADDDVLRASHFLELQFVLSELRAKYGPHPLLLETEADFTDEPPERVALYEQAIQVALREEIITFTIRLSLARVLLDHFGDAKRALRELLACRDEITERADDSERREWHELVEQCNKKGQP